MANNEANVLRVPGVSGPTTPTNAPEILGSYAKFTQKGLTIKSGAGVLKAGTLLKLSGTANKYTGATATSDTIVGVLRKEVDATSEDKLGNYVVSGLVKTSELRFADGTVLTSGEVATVATALSGRVDTIHGYMSF